PWRGASRPRGARWPSGARRRSRRCRRSCCCCARRALRERSACWATSTGWRCAARSPRRRAASPSQADVLIGGPRRPLVALLTDYGAGSQYVGALHLAIAGRCPAADRVDLAHDVPPGDVTWGALLLAWLAPLAPPSAP